MKERSKTSICKSSSLRFCLQFFLVMMVVLSQFPGFSQDLAEETVIECPDPWQLVFPGDTVTFNLKVKNLGYSYDSYLLEIGAPLPENWIINFYLGNKRVKEIGIEPRQSVNLVLQVKIPSDEIPGDYPFTVYANGTYSVANQNLKVTVESILYQYKTELYCPLVWQVAYPGDNLTFNLRVRNLTPYHDSYFVYIDDPPLPENWTANFYVGNRQAKEIEIDAQQSFDLVLKVEVPRDATIGDRNFRVNFAGVYSNATKALTITVREMLRKIEVTSPFKSETIMTGQSTSYMMMVMNEGKNTEKVFLGVNVSAAMARGWDISFSQDQLVLNEKEGQWVKLNVRPPETARKGTYPIEVIATTEDGEANASIQLFAEVIVDYLLEIVDIQPINPQVTSGDKIEITVVVRNMGLSPISKVRLNVNSSAISNILVTPLDILAMEPKQSASFRVRLSPNVDATTGDYSISVQASSDEARSSIRVVAVSVVSSIPWFWITIGITVIATALAIIAIQKTVSKYGISIRRKR